MSRLLSCSAIADRALREIGAFSTYDLSADPQQHDVALQYLDLVVSELAGVENLWFLRPARQTIPIPANTPMFSLSGLLTTNLQFFSSARILLPEDTTDEIDLDMVRRAEYDEIRSKGDPGDPRVIYIERNDKPNAYVWPVADRTGIMLVLDGQAYADTASDNDGKNTTNFPAAWQRYLIKKTAADIGSGPVYVIPADERQQKAQEAAAALALLLPRNNREQVRRPRSVQPYNPLRAACDPPMRRRDYGQ